MPTPQASGGKPVGVGTIQPGVELEQLLGDAHQARGPASQLMWPLLALGGIFREGGLVDLVGFHSSHQSISPA